MSESWKNEKIGMERNFIINYNGEQALFKSEEQRHRLIHLRG